jgi:hypothetical protein
MIKFLTLRQFICPLSLFFKEIPFASLTIAIDVKIERVLTGFLVGWNTLDWLKHSWLAETLYFSQSNLKILRRSEVTINLTRRLKKNGSKWVRPLVVFYSFFFRTHLAPVHCPRQSSKLLHPHFNRIVNVDSDSSYSSPTSWLSLS